MDFDESDDSGRFTDTESDSNEGTSDSDEPEDSGGGGLGSFQDTGRFGGTAGSRTDRTSHSGTGPDYTASSDRWNWRVDFSSPYVLVARDHEGNVYKHRDHLAILDDNLDWRRLEDHPNKEFEVLYQCPTERDWLRFCTRAQDQLGESPEDVLDDDPKRLAELREKTYFPPRDSPDDSRTCAVCGASHRQGDDTIVEIDLRSSARTAVCADHTVRELAHEGLLE